MISKKKCIFFTILLLFLVPVSLSAGNSQYIVPTGSKLYNRIQALAIQQQLHLPSGNGPWSVSELSTYLDWLKASAPFTSQQTACLFADTQLFIEQMLQKTAARGEESLLKYQLNFEVQLESYLHTSSSDFFNEDEEWFHDYTDRAPLAKVSLEFDAADSFYGYTELTAQNNRFYMGTESTEDFFGKLFATNLVFDDTVGNLDASFPRRAFLSAGGKFWNMQFGRDQLNWGQGETGNLLLSDHLDYHEFIKLSLFSPSAKFTSLIASFDPAAWYTDQSNEPLMAVKYLIAHSFEFSPTQRLSVAVTEAFMFQGEVFDFSFLNPLMFFHNFYMEQNSNSFLTLDLNWALLPGVAFYAQFAIDEITAPWESGTHPAAYGYLGGIKFSRFIDDVLVESSLEVAYTDPYLYLRNLVDPPINFIVGQRQFVREVKKKIADEDFLGYEYGCDALVINWGSRLSWDSGFHISSQVFFMAHGTHDQNTEIIYTPDGLTPGAITPTSFDHTNSGSLKDAVAYTCVLSNGFRYPVNRIFSVHGTIDYIRVWNPGNISANPPAADMQLTTGIRWEI